MHYILNLQQGKISWKYEKFEKNLHLFWQICT